MYSDFIRAPADILAIDFRGAHLGHSISRGSHAKQIQKSIVIVQENFLAQPLCNCRWDWKWGSMAEDVESSRSTRESALLALPPSLPLSLFISLARHSCSGSDRGRLPLRSMSLASQLRRSSPSTSNSRRRISIRFVSLHLASLFPSFLPLPHPIPLIASPSLLLSLFAFAFCIPVVSPCLPHPSPVSVALSIGLSTFPWKSATNRTHNGFLTCIRHLRRRDKKMGWRILEAILALGIIVGMLCVMGNAQYYIHKAAHGRPKHIRNDVWDVAMERRDKKIMEMMSAPSQD
ncbi:hypothetical protein ACLOJK_036964 [Asimina triloba]